MTCALASRFAIARGIGITLESAINFPATRSARKLGAVICAALVASALATPAHAANIERTVDLGSYTKLALTWASDIVVDDARGTVIVAGQNATDGQVVILTPDGEVLDALHVPDPEALVIVGDALFVAETSASAIAEFDLSQDPPALVGTYPTAPLAHPRHLVFAVGMLWFVTECGGLDSQLGSMTLTPSHQVTQAEQPPDSSPMNCPMLSGGGYLSHELFITDFYTQMRHFHIASGVASFMRYGPTPYNADLIPLPDGTDVVAGWDRYRFSDFSGPLSTWQAGTATDYITAQAVSPGSGGILATAVNPAYGEDVWVFHIDDPAPVNIYDFPATSGDNDVRDGAVYPGGLALTADGATMFALTGANADPGIVIFRALRTDAQDPTLDLEVDAPRIDFGKSTMLTAHLDGPDAGSLVRFYRRPAGGSLHLMTTQAVDSSGLATLRVEPQVNTTYSAEFKGDDGWFPAASPTVSVTVNSVLTTKLYGAYGRDGNYKLFHTGRTVLFAIHCEPPRPNKPITFNLQRATSHGWRYAATDHFRQDRRGNLAIGFSGLPIGRYRVGAAIGDDRYHGGDISRWLLFKVT